MRNYTLITGATGLLGAYLLRNFLMNDDRCAVLVRSSRSESSIQRVETILARTEKELGITLARPVVLEGSLTENFGLDSERIEWVKRRCARIVHNAASLTFERDPKTNEPYRSNVEGTQCAVDFALKCGIPQFHHISTAYVCGLREGVCKEDELDVGQQWGNDYEKAKVQAEKIVRSAPFLEPPTFYRPAIITGDSTTGYTSTYHGFYTPLRVVASILQLRDFHESFDNMIEVLGMRGFERKNFVPVEWIAQCVVALASNPKNVGRTFHLAPRNRVTVGQMYDVFVRALTQYAERHADEIKAREAKRNSSVVAEMFGSSLTSFRDQMKVYRSYWRDDPIFDSSNRDGALPQLPCPEMNEDVLLRLSTFALEANFGWPKPKPIYPNSFVRDLLPVKPSFRCDVPLSAAPKRVVVEARGAGGGAWIATLRDGRIEAMEEGATTKPDASLTLSASVLAKIREGSLAPRKALESGAILWQADGDMRESGQNVLLFLDALLQKKS